MRSMVTAGNALVSGWRLVMCLAPGISPLCSGGTITASVGLQNIAIMPFNYNSIVEGATAGVVASILLGALVVIRDCTRHAILRLRLRHAFRHPSIGSGLHGVSVSISNTVGWPFTVRDVAIVTDECSYLLSPTGRVTTTFKGQYPAPTRAQKKALKRGESVEIGSEMSATSWISEPTSEGFVAVGPYTCHQFVMPPHITADFSGTVKSLRITLDYTSPSGVVHILRIQERRWAEHLARTIQRYKEAQPPRPDEPSSAGATEGR